MKMRRTLLTAGVFALLAMIYVPTPHRGLGIAENYPARGPILSEKSNDRSALGIAAQSSLSFRSNVTTVDPSCIAIHARHFLPNDWRRWRL